MEFNTRSEARRTLLIEDLPVRVERFKPTKSVPTFSWQTAIERPILCAWNITNSLSTEIWSNEKRIGRVESLKESEIRFRFGFRGLRHCASLDTQVISGVRKRMDFLLDASSLLLKHSISDFFIYYYSYKIWALYSFL